MQFFHLHKGKFRDRDEGDNCKEECPANQYCSKKSGTCKCREKQLKKGDTCEGKASFEVSYQILFELFTTLSRLLNTLKKQPFENIMGKGENAGNQHFLLFP